MVGRGAVRSLAVVGVVVGGLVAGADVAGGVEREGQWSLRFAPMGLEHGYDDGNARCLGSWAGYLVVGGWFEQAGAVEATRIAAWDGERWLGFGGGPDGEVNAIYDHGVEMVIGGNFSQVGGQERPYVARYDGVDRLWYDMGDVGGEVVDFVERFGRLYAVGSYENPDFPGAPPYTPLAWWDGVAWTYEPVYGWHLWDNPLSCAVVDTSFLIGGEIQIGDGYGLMKWDGGGTGMYAMDATVTAVEDAPDGAYIGGWFTTAGGEPSPGLAFMNGELELFPVPAPPAEFWSQRLTRHGDVVYCADDYEVRSYAPPASWSAPLGGTFAAAVLDVRWHGGSLYAAGNVPNGVVRWDDGEWVALGGGLGTAHTHPHVDCLAHFGGDIYAGGTFGLPSVTDERPAGAGIGRWDGDAWHAVDGGVDQEVLALCVYGDALWVGGNFHRAGALETANLARFDGTSWHDVGGAGGRVHGFTIHDGELIAGGAFGTIGGIVAPRVAAFDGATWRPLATTLPGTVKALASFHGDLIAAGSFTSVDGQAAGNIARWDGVQWHAMDGGMDGTVNALVEWQGELYAGGIFASAGGEPAANLARWDGARWRAVGGGLAGDDLIWGVTALLGTTGDLFVGGDFATAGGAPIAALAAWDGAAWSEFGGGLTALPSYAPSVRALLVAEGDLWLGGQFWEAGGTPSCNIARWIDGTLVPTFLQDFTVRAEGDAVVARWSTSSPAAAGDFRLDARCGPRAWTVPCAAAEGRFAARDASAQLAASGGREVVYTLWLDEGLGGWAALAERALVAPAPAAGLRLAAGPNPFNPRLEIAFTLGRAAAATVGVYALDGRRVATVFAGDLAAGRHTVAWDGRDASGAPAASGSYVLRVATEDAVEARQVTLVR